MRRQHCRRSGAGATVVAVAAMRDTPPRNDLAEALLARLAVAKQHGIDAYKSEIMQRLNHRDAAGTRRIISGGGDQWKGVVEMNDMRAARGDQATHG